MREHGDMEGTQEGRAGDTGDRDGNMAKRENIGHSDMGNGVGGRRGHTGDM